MSDDAREFINKLMREENANTEKAKKKLPKVLAVYRAKFLKALGKYDGEIDLQQDTSLEGLFWKPLIPLKTPLSENSKFFDDSIIINEFRKIKRPNFDLVKYIGCVKWFLHVYLGSDSNYKLERLNVQQILCYVLAHARDFHNPASGIYKFSDEGTEELIEEEPKCDRFINDDIPGDNRYIQELNKLMNDLIGGYDEAKFQKLNLNVTYLILLMARRLCRNKDEIVKAFNSDKVHGDYATLCPQHLKGCRLPAMSREANNMMEAYLKSGKFVLLLLYGYHKSSRITRRVFRATCIAYMEYNGLALPMLFEKVSELYAVPKDRLWEMMSETKQVNALQALFTIADYYYTVYEAGNTKTFELFPFCRVYGQMYHSNMSGKCEENYEACYALALLVDKKLGMEKSFMRNSAWTKQFSCVWQNKGAVIATEVYKKIMEQNV